VALAADLGKPLHLHVDQKNLAAEDGTERALRAIADLGLPAPPAGAEPAIWLVHAISPSAYDEPRFVEDLVRNVAVRLRDDERIDRWTVRVTNHESIHQHNAYAVVKGRR
jgi:hypothetical protein